MKYLRAVGCTLLWLTACSPALDWRLIRPNGLGVEVAFPCRPASHARKVLLVGQPVEMTLFACSIDGQTFGLASAELSDVRQVDAALAELADAAARNIAGTVEAEGNADVPGMTPNTRARRLRLAGRLPDGRAVIEHAVVFAHGARIYQATLHGSGPTSEVVGVFFASLKVRT